MNAEEEEEMHKGLRTPLFYSPAAGRLAEHSRKSPDDVAAGLLRRERNKSSIK
jgi:hypothetical protein